jgi:hypothetical protein
MVNGLGMVALLVVVGLGGLLGLHLVDVVNQGGADMGE